MKLLFFFSFMLAYAFAQERPPAPVPYPGPQVPWQRPLPWQPPPYPHYARPWEERDYRIPTPRESCQMELMHQARDLCEQTAQDFGFNHRAHCQLYHIEWKSCQAHCTSFYDRVFARLNILLKPVCGPYRNTIRVQEIKVRYFD